MIKVLCFVGLFFFFGCCREVSEEGDYEVGHPLKAWPHYKQGLYLSPATPGSRCFLAPLHITSMG